MRFIEVTPTDKNNTIYENAKVFINVYKIITVGRYNGQTIIVVKSGDSTAPSYVVESYEEVKQLIQKASQLGKGGIV